LKEDKKKGKRNKKEKYIDTPRTFVFRTAHSETEFSSVNISFAH